MPIYEYRCESCGAEHEVIQKISDPLLVTCPNCSQDSLKKKLTASAFRLSGSGWYETDFKTGDKKRNLVGDGNSGGGDGKKAESAGSANKSADKKTGSDKGSASS